MIILIILYKIHKEKNRNKKIFKPKEKINFNKKILITLKMNKKIYLKIDLQ